MPSNRPAREPECGSITNMNDDEVAHYRATAPQLYDAYAAAWGPVVQAVSVRHEASGAPINVLLFARAGDAVVRFATHGLALAPDADGVGLGIELLLTAAPDLAGVEPRAAVDFVFDVAATLLTHSLRPAPPVLMPPSDASPWLPSALLFDEPLLEPESIAALEADGAHVHLVAMIPIHPEEYEALDVADDVATEVDRLAALMDLTWTDLRRAPSPAVWLRP